MTDTPRIFTADGQTLRQGVSRRQPAPDGNGTFDTFDALGIEDDGAASFYATFAGTSGGFTLDDRGLYRGDGITDLAPAPLEEVIRSGDLIASIWVVGNLDPLLVGSREDGLLAFAPFVSLVGDPSTTSSLLLVDDGILRSIDLMAGDPSPDGNGTIFSFSTPFVGGDGRVATNVVFAGSTGGLGDNMGVASFSSVLGDRVLVREGDTAPGGETFAVDFVDASGFASSLVAPNRFVFHAFLNGASGGSSADEGLFLARDGDVLEIVREGDPTPELDGDFELLRLNQAHVNESGTVAFFATVRNQTSLGHGIFRWSPDFGLSTLARIGQPLLGSTIQSVFFMDDLDARRAGVSPINAFGEVTFKVRLQDGREAIIGTSPVPEPRLGTLVGLLFLAQLAAAHGRRRSPLRARQPTGAP